MSRQDKLKTGMAAALKAANYSPWNGDHRYSLSKPVTTLSVKTVKAKKAKSVEIDPAAATMAAESQKFIETPKVAPSFPAVFGRFIVHVDAPTIIANRDTGSNNPVVVVRRFDDLETKIMCREAIFSSPTRMCHRPNRPLPGTNGRGVSWAETDGPITIVTDDADPFVIV